MTNKDSVLLVKEEIHRELKSIAAKKGLQLKEFVDQVISNFLEEFKKKGE